MNIVLYFLEENADTTMLFLIFAHLHRMPVQCFYKFEKHMLTLQCVLLVQFVPYALVDLCGTKAGLNEVLLETKLQIYVGSLGQQIFKNK